MRRPPGCFRIVSWNVCMALHDKLGYLEALEPDIAILPEIAEGTVLRQKCGGAFRPTSFTWCGDRKHKGLGIATFGDWKLEPVADSEPLLNWILPAHVRGPVDFFLLGVWAMGTVGGRKTDMLAAYQVQAALDRYGDLISRSPTVVVGDFNNHVRWDRPNGHHNHGTNIARLAGHDLISAYHEHHGLAQGDELHPTLFWMHSAPGVKDYHIDYCFFPRPWLPALRSVAIGSHADYVATHASDHVPVIVDLATDLIPQAHQGCSSPR